MKGDRDFPPRWRRRLVGACESARRFQLAFLDRILFAASRGRHTQKNR